MAKFIFVLYFRRSTLFQVWQNVAKLIDNYSVSPLIVLLGSPLNLKYVCLASAVLQRITSKPVQLIHQTRLKNTDVFVECVTTISGLMALITKCGDGGGCVLMHRLTSGSLELRRCFIAQKIGNTRNFCGKKLNNSNLLFKERYLKKHCLTYHLLCPYWRLFH